MSRRSFEPHHVHEENRWRRENPELARAQDEAEARDELARVRRLGLEVLLPAPNEWTDHRIASANEPDERSKW